MGQMSALWTTHGDLPSALPLDAEQQQSLRATVQKLAFDFYLRQTSAEQLSTLTLTPRAASMSV